jgi:hypothetical protein
MAKKYSFGGGLCPCVSLVGYMKHQEVKLIRRARDGDPEAFKTLDSLYHEITLHEASRIVGDLFKAEDIRYTSRNI